MIKKLMITGSSILFFMIVCVGGYSLYEHYRPASMFPSASESLLIPFKQTNTPPAKEDYANLFRYFVEGFMVYKSPLGARAYYPGMPMKQGKDMASLEGFSRIAPLLASWLHGNRDQQIKLTNGQAIDIVELLRTGLLAGTDPGSKEYWGVIKHNQNSIVEAADIALTLWLSKDTVWNGFTSDQKHKVAAWLNQVNGKKVPNNNWHLFVVQVNSVLADLGMEHDTSSLNQHYSQAKSFYAGDGWFKDGIPHGVQSPFDYYNAWGFHYHLQWIAKIRPLLDVGFINDALVSFLGSYKYLIGPEGFPIMGRSVCYRMAVPAPLIFGQAIRPDRVTPGEARRALDSTWQYFISHGAVRFGAITQGYCGNDARVLGYYSGPASCFWSLRSLIAALALPDDAPFWQAAPEPLPVEKGDYELDIKPIGWTVKGNHEKHSITVSMNPRTTGSAPPQLISSGIVDRLMEYITGKSHRPDNSAVAYGLGEYRSDEPFCDCLR